MQVTGCAILYIAKLGSRITEHVLRGSFPNRGITNMNDETIGRRAALTPVDRLAYERTRLAYENTMMGWVRTATSLITFGFTIYKFFQLELRGGAPSGRLIGPREFGLTMVVIGLVAMLVATWEHRVNNRLLRSECPTLPRSTAGVVAALVALLGILALILMIFRQ
jgi:inner membrane protein YidH